jgi:hypothetical protein
VKLFEVMGFTTFNIMVAMVLSATFFGKAEEAQSTYIQELNNENVTQFIETVAYVASGKKADMDSYAITTYLMDHIAADSNFNSTITYNISDNFEDNQEEVMDMSKLEFISHVLSNLKSMERHETQTNVEFVEVAEDKRTASAVITTYERGMMPTVSEFGEDTLVPVRGTSFCEQKFALTQENVLQITEASCATDLDFSIDY